MEFGNVKDVINFLFELGDPATLIFVDGRNGNIDDFKEELREALYQLCDMLGMEDLYLYPSKDEEADQMKPIIAVLIACLVYVTIFVGVSWVKDKINDWNDK